LPDTGCFNTARPHQKACKVRALQAFFIFGTLEHQSFYGEDHMPTVDVERHNDAVALRELLLGRKPRRGAGTP